MAEILVGMEIILLVSKMLIVSRSPRGNSWIFVTWMCLYMKEEEGLGMQVVHLPNVFPLQNIHVF